MLWCLISEHSVLFIAFVAIDRIRVDRKKLVYHEKPNSKYIENAAYLNPKNYFRIFADISDYR